MAPGQHQAKGGSEHGECRQTYEQIEPLAFTSRAQYLALLAASNTREQRLGEKAVHGGGPEKHYKGAHAEEGDDSSNERFPR